MIVANRLIVKKIISLLDEQKGVVFSVIVVANDDDFRRPLHVFHGNLCG